jgi:prolipoprotein diacylglyceryltransferase
VLLYSLARIVLEFFRADPRGFIISSYLSVTQGISVLLAIGSLIMLHLLGKRKS